MTDHPVSGYFNWRHRKESRRSLDNRKLLMEIKAIHNESGATYGSPRIHQELRERGLRCSENRVARLMRLHEVRPKQPKRFRVTTDSKHNLPVAENVLSLWLRRNHCESKVGGRHHIHMDEGRLALPGRGHGSILTKDCRLVDAGKPEADAGHRRTQDGASGPATQRRPAASQRPR